VTDDDAMDEQHTIWEDWAQADPLWAILSDPTRKGGQEDARPAPETSRPG